MKDILIRALKTFIQGFLANLMLSIGNLSNMDEKLLKSALLGATAGGISALMNFIIKLLDTEGGVKMEEEKVVEEAKEEVVSEEAVVEEATEEVKTEE